MSDSQEPKPNLLNPDDEPLWLVKVVAINFHADLVLTDDNKLGRITEYVDGEGDAVEKGSPDAEYAIVKWDEPEFWAALSLDDALENYAPSGNA